MKIALISTMERPYDIGLRIISSELKKVGHETEVIFMAISGNYKKLYPIKTLKELKNLCKDSKLIGISSFASTANRAVQIIDFIKPLQIPIIWGGIHATICPEKCIKHCGIVCVGEGEETIVELANAIENNKSIDNIQNLWIKKNNKIIKNPVRYLIDELDRVAMPDHSFKNHYILDKNKIREFRDSDLKGKMLFLGGRGCPHSCTYCSNSILNELYKGKRKCILRWHSVGYIMKVLTDIRNKFSYTNGFFLEDDTFLQRSTEDIKLFCKEYKEKINLPFEFMTDPHSITEEKVKLIADAGCVCIMLGLQGSEKTNFEVYKRYVSDEVTLRASKILNKFKDKMIIEYSIIGCNPYETTKEKVNLIKLLRKIDKPYRLAICNLLFLYGTKLYQRAIEDGTIKTEKDTGNHLTFVDRGQHILLRKKDVYLNLIINLMRGFADENKHGSLSNSMLDFLLKEERVKWHTKHQFISIMATRVLIMNDFIKQRILKPIFNLMPVSLRQSYLKNKYKDKLVSTIFEIKV